jgi:hypothetical protein
MIQAIEPDAPEFTAYAVGICYASVCTSLESINEVARRLNAEHPTGVGRWHPSEDPTFADGQPNPRPCDDHPATHRHILFNC